MQIGIQGELGQFDDLPYGSLFIGTIRGTGIVRAIKAFNKEPDKDKPHLTVEYSHIITVGPFTGDDDGVPGVYSPGALADGSVLNITEGCRFVPSSIPEHLSSEVPATRDSLGLAFLGPDTVILGVRFFTGGSSWQAAFLDVVSGELLHELPKEVSFVARSWEIVKQDRNGKFERLCALEQ